MAQVRYVAALLFTAIIGVAVAPLVLAEPSIDPRTDDLATLVNQARLDHDLLPLARSPQLDAAAQEHSQDMVANRYLDHVGSDGSTPQERADRAGYVVPPQSGWIVVEVISAVSDQPAGPLNWWLTESTGVHRRVLMNPRWREFGVGYAAGGEYGNYWTLLVGCRPGVLPAVTFAGNVYAPTELCG